MAKLSLQHSLFERVKNRINLERTFFIALPWLGWLFTLLTFWYVVISYYQYQNLKQELKRMVTRRSEEMGIVYLGSKNPESVNKIHQILSEDSRFILLQGLGVSRQVPKDALRGFKVILPISIYTVPVGHLEYLIPYGIILKATFQSPPFWIGSTLVTLFTLLVGILKHLVRTLKERNQLYEQNLEFREKVTHQLIHDLKSPLSLLRIMAEADEEYPQTIEELKMKLNNYQRHLQWLDRRLQNILKELDPSKTEDPTSIIDLKSFCEHLCGQISYQFNQSVKFSWDQRIDLDEVSIPFAALSRVIQNILMNAAEANLETKGKEVFLELCLRENQLVIRCIDEGIGFSPSQNTTIRSTKVGPHRGRGLSIVKDYIQKLGGFLEFQKKDPQGTIAIVTFPLSESHPLDQTAPAESPEIDVSRFQDHESQSLPNPICIS